MTLVTWFWKFWWDCLHNRSDIPATDFACDNKTDMDDDTVTVPATKNEVGE